MFLKEATPFLLGRIVEITKGASFTDNMGLVNNNARLGAPVARDTQLSNGAGARSSSGDPILPGEPWCLTPTVRESA